MNSEASRYISSAVHRPEGDSCFSIYQHMISWIKITKKGNFGTLKTSLSSNFVYNFQTFRGFFQVNFFTILLQIQCETIIFHLPVNTTKPKFVALLVFVCMTALVIVQISSSKNVSK